MKNKGFTLIEVIAIIAILAVLGAMVAPVINGYVTDSREELYEQQINNIEEAAKEWGAHNIGLLPSSSSDAPYKLTLGKLIDDGYFLLNEIKDPRTREAFSRDNTIITISYDSIKKKLKYSVSIDGSQVR